MNSSNRKPFILLYGDKTTQTQEQSEIETEASAGENDPDFPPCRIGKKPPLFSCSPALPTKSRYRQSASCSESSWPSTGTGLGHTNILNTVTVTGSDKATTKLSKVLLVGLLFLHCSITNVKFKHQTRSRRKPFLKCQCSLDSENERPLKKQRDDMTVTVTTMQRDIACIKENIGEVGEEVACVKENIEEMAHEMREERDNLHSMLVELLAEVQQFERD